MIKTVINWIKTHKLTTILLAVIGVFIFRSTVSTMMGMSRNSYDYSDSDRGFMAPSTGDVSYGKSASYEAQSESYASDVVPDSSGSIAVEVNDRMVSKNYSLSLVGESVIGTAEIIASEVDKLGGFVVSNSTKNYQDTMSAYITARVPADKSKAFIESIKKLTKKVVSQDENASDITDAYTDVQENLRLLEGTKVRFEEIWKASTRTQDMLQTLREIQNIQREIDNLKGKEKYYTELAKYSYFNINLSKDEMDLPYMPSESWSAEYVFKSAVRELVRAFRWIATQAIWLVVFAVIWLPIMLVLGVVIRRYKSQIIG